MKALVLFWLIVVGPVALAQDKIYCHANRRVIHGDVTEIGEHSVSFRYAGETVINSLGNALIEKIVFRSGRVQYFSQKVDVYGRNGWQNVMITNNPNEVIGLRRLGEIRSKAGGVWSNRTTKKVDKKATERIKREAVELGGHIVFIQQHETTGRGFYRNPESFQSGVAYGY